MSIELSKETEALVVAAVAKGRFESVEAFLTAVTSEYLKKNARSSQQAPVGSDNVKEERERSWEEF